MPADSWVERPDESEPLYQILYGEENSTDETESSYRGYAGRRYKAAFVLLCVWLVAIVIDSIAWGAWVVACLLALSALYSLRLSVAPVPEEPQPSLPEDLPFVSLVAAAKDEEAVIEQLVDNLCDLDYPSDRYEVCIVEDGSSDGTAQRLDRLARHRDRLKILHRPPNAGGGKSGALNSILDLAQGDIIAVFDADARVDRDLLQRVLPAFDRPQVGAVQVRKVISNADTNFWTRGQAAEMALDTYLQQQRVARGGVGELRGNGQFIRRSALDRCGWFNEETITDDLDLTLRLHLDGWDIDILALANVREEGVTQFRALWNQRSRWAEGGYQRYLDYWRLLVRNRMGTRKTLDAFAFFAVQYLLPSATIPDIVVSLLRHQMPMFLPMSALAIAASGVGMANGIARLHRREQVLSLWTILRQSLRGTLYFVHWFAAIAVTTTRVAIFPKRLKWVKTVHSGENGT
jgi:1,2-diacylglycerol 3-beta-glucosyltransferase